MTIPEILKELAVPKRALPLEAMNAAVEQREAITPELLRIIEAMAENPKEWAERKTFLFQLFSLFLLAQFREKRAYPIIVKMVSWPGETPSDLLGTAVSSGLSQILISVYDGDPTLLEGLVENDKLYEFVRAAAISAFLGLENTGQMSRAKVVEYFRALFHGRLGRESSYAWDRLVCAVADLGAPELLPEVRQAYAEGLVNSWDFPLKTIEDRFANPHEWEPDRPTLVKDAIDEMEAWTWPDPEDSPTEEDLLDALPMNQIPPPPPPVAAPPSVYVPPVPFVREPKIGRNDPCPCGSGKKYKKCCGT